MRLSNIDLARLLPVFMQDDKTAKIFVSLLNKELRKVAKSVDMIRIYSNMDSLDEHILDELAWQFNVTEYRNTYNIETKRKLLKNCLASHHRRGTVSSIKEVVQNIFGNAIVEEWFEYGGEPYYFRVRTANTSATDEMIEEVTSVIKLTQNIRSHLESVTIEMDNEMNLYVGTLLSLVIDTDTLEVDTSDVDFGETVEYLAICGSSTAICGEVYCGT